MTIVVTCLRALGGPAHADALAALRSAVSAPTHIAPAGPAVRR